MTKHIIPAEVLAQHVAVLGKTGSGKSATSRLCVEQVVDDGFRVCILDTIKSDWWGLTSSADGKKPGLPFKILGGPRGHVPLHSSAGKAIGHLVGQGKLPLSILDMADFEPGGVQKFFSDFAAELMRSMRGVLYLVVEEAHEVCLSDDTEILTRSGFKRHSEIVEGEDAVCFDLASESYRYGQIERVIRRDYSGEMVRMVSDGLDSLTTPDHRAVIKRVQRGGPERYKLYDWTFCQADKIPTCVAVPIGGAPIGDGIDGLSEDDARILGWLITDGNFHRGRETWAPKLAMCQGYSTVKMGRKILEEMDALLSKIPGVSRHERPARKRHSINTAAGSREINGGPSVSWYFGGDSSERFLRWLGDSVHRVPRLILDKGSEAQLRALWLGLMEGDGSEFNGKWKTFIPGMKHGLADDFQELSLRLGISVTTKFEKKRSGWKVMIANQRSKHWSRKPSQENYDGLVWDVTVPTGAFVARRNGKVFVTGNCPKERAGFGAENLSIHWAKKLATAGRSKGIRLIVLTQRVQSLHNAVLGSCETVIAHRLTTPADQAPIVAWLKANADKKAQAAVADSLSSLPTGTAWVCSGEAKIFEKIAFPKFKTYDNAATPTGDDFDHDVKTAQVDQAELRAIIGDALKEAEANDPKALKAKVAQLTKELSGKGSAAIDPEAERKAEARGETRGRAAGFDEGRRVGFAEGEKAALKKAQSALGAIQADEPTLAALPSRAISLPAPKPVPAPRPERKMSIGAGVTMPKAERLVLTALAQYPSGRTKVQIAILTGYASSGGGFNNALSSLRTKGWATGHGTLTITDAGVDALGEYEPLPSGRALLDHWLNQLSKAERGALEALANAYPNTLSKEEVAAAAGYEPKGGGFNNALSRLRTLELISGRGELRASDDLFDEAA